MIPFSFIYVKPDSPGEAAKVYEQLDDQGKRPMYYGGGSEVISMSRTGNIHPGAIIDLKGIQECLAIDVSRDTLVIGSMVTLSRIKEAKVFPALGAACGRIADHTNQCRITLGGNLCGTIIYRETSLPLMLGNADVAIYGPRGSRTESFNDVFQKRMQLESGEFVAQVRVPIRAVDAPYMHVKKTTNEKIDYPLVGIAALRHGDEIRVAFSGLCAFPFRNAEIERILNDQSIGLDEKLIHAMKNLPAPAHSDVEGSGEYRVFVAKNTLGTMLKEWDHATV